MVHPLLVTTPYFEVCHPRCVYALISGCVVNNTTVTKNLCVLHNTVEHNYISPSSTLGL